MLDYKSLLRIMLFIFKCKISQYLSSTNTWTIYMGGMWINAKFDKNLNSMTQKLHEPFKNVQVAG